MEQPPTLLAGDRAENFDGFLAGLPPSEDLVTDGWTSTWARFAEAARASKDAPSDHKTISQPYSFQPDGK